MYKLLYTEEARKQIHKLEQHSKTNLREGLEQIAKDPTTGKPLKHELKGRWSYPVGDYRIIYRIYRSEVVVLILAVGHRRNIYLKTARRDAN